MTERKVASPRPQRRKEMEKLSPELWSNPEKVSLPIYLAKYENLYIARFFANSRLF
jgi:hypothetical protein